MAKSTVEWQQRAGDLGLGGGFDLDADYQTLANQILPRLFDALETTPKSRAHGHNNPVEPQPAE